MASSIADVHGEQGSRRKGVVDLLLTYICRECASRGKGKKEKALGRSQVTALVDFFQLRFLLVIY